MNYIKKILYHLRGLYKFGILRYCKILKVYSSDYQTLKRQKASNMDFVFGKKYPCFADRYAEGGTTKDAYFHQDLLVARRIFKNNPEEHTDVGSRVDGFVAHVASFRKINVVDIRPITSRIPNITFIQQDMMEPLKSSMIASCDSLSCLHALEHFGLGRYGDPINYDGHLIGFNNLHKILREGGKMYFSVPLGLPQRIEFHAHRIFSVKYLLQLFAGKYRIDHFSFVDDHCNLHTDVTLNALDIENNFGVIGDGCSCAIFEMTKI